jgi:hypothetical protein
MSSEAAVGGEEGAPVHHVPPRFWVKCVRDQIHWLKILHKLLVSYLLVISYTGIAVPSVGIKFAFQKKDSSKQTYCLVTIEKDSSIFVKCGCLSINNKQW